MNTKEWLANRQEFRKNIMKNNIEYGPLNVKIKKTLRKRGIRLNINDFCNLYQNADNKIKSVIDACLCKNPGRQTRHQHDVKKCINNIQNIELINIDNGYLGQKGFLIKEDITSKTIDFTVTKDNKVIYIFAKRINGFGGSQGNEFIETYNWIQRAIKNNNLNNYFAVVYSGNYFTPTRRKELQKLCNNNVQAMTLRNFRTWLINL